MFEDGPLVKCRWSGGQLERWALVGARVAACSFWGAAAGFVLWLPWSGLVLASAGAVWTWVAWVTAGYLGRVEGRRSH